MVALCAAGGFYNVAIHEHTHSEAGLAYQKLRNKPYPWPECPDCNIFDLDCWKNCRAEAAGSE